MGELIRFQPVLCQCGPNETNSCDLDQMLSQDPTPLMVGLCPLRLLRLQQGGKGMVESLDPGHSPTIMMTMSGGDSRHSSQLGIWITTGSVTLLITGKAP